MSYTILVSYVAVLGLIFFSFYSGYVFAILLAKKDHNFFWLILQTVRHSAAIDVVMVATLKDTQGAAVGVSLRLRSTPYYIQVMSRFDKNLSSFTNLQLPIFLVNQFLF